MHKIVTFKASMVMFPLWELPLTTWDRHSKKSVSGAVIEEGKPRDFAALGREQREDPLKTEN